MTFSQWRHWKDKSTRTWHCVIGCVETSISKEHSVLKFGNKQSWRHCLTLKINTQCCYTTLELYTQWHGHIPKELNLAVCWQICDTKLHRHLWYHVHGSVQSQHFFASQHLWCFELSSYLHSQQLTPNCYWSSSHPSYMVLQGCTAQQ